MTAFATPASLLFVPGSAPERFAKALGAGADMVCIDLEDAVPPAGKGDARRNALDALADPDAARRICIRINRLGSPEGLADAAALSASPRRPAALMMPKVESPRDAELLAAAIPAPLPIIALLESARGVEASFAVAASPAVDALLFGSFDYAADTGGTQDWDALLSARARIVAAAAAANKPAIESPYPALADVEGAAAEDVRSRRLGMAGRAAIHPRMLPGIHAAFRPSRVELDEARRIVRVFEDAGGAAASLDGKLVELPVVLRMRRLLARSS